MNHVCMIYVRPYMSSFTEFYVCIIYVCHASGNVKLSTPNNLAGIYMYTLPIRCTQSKQQCVQGYGRAEVLGLQLQSCMKS